MDPTWAALLSRRLDRHHLTEPATSAADVAAATCGVHAQILSAGELSIGQRLAGADRDDVRTALWDTRELVKTFGPRGTVHLLPTRDLPRWTGGLAAVPRPLPSFDPSVRLAPAQLDEVVAGIGAVLTDAELTIDELDVALADEVGAWAVERCVPAFQDLWPRWRQAVDTAANRGVLCFGPVRDRKVTYTSPQRWSPGFAPAPGPAAVTWLARSYLRSYGPARPEHFAQWLGAAKPWAATLFETLAAAGEIEPVGEWGWVDAGDTAFPAQAPRGLRLLPYFDAYVVGSHPRDLVYPGAAAGRALARRQAGNYPVLLVDGVVGGVWHQRRSGRKLAITVEPLRELTATQRRQLDDEVELVGAVMEAKPTLTVGTVTVGPHA
jgi:Winged helix DNA-binding domain